MDGEGVLSLRGGGGEFTLMRSCIHHVSASFFYIQN